MTNEAAHALMEDLQRIFTQYRFMFSDKLAEANGLAILALEKQMQPKKGKWIDATDTSGGDYYRCSECGTYIEKMYFANDYMVNFCPNCGAEMGETR